MGGGRLAATIVASPVLVWVRGRDVAFPSGTEATAFINGDVRVDEARIRPQLGAPAEATSGFRGTSSADRANANPALTNTDILEMQQAGVPESVILTKIRNSDTDFQTTPRDLAALRQAGVTDAAMKAMVSPSEP